MNKDEGVFLFGNFTGTQIQREAPYLESVFNIRASYRQETQGLVDHLVRMGIKKIGLFIQYDSYGRSGANGVKRALSKHGLKIIEETTYSRGDGIQTSMKTQADRLIKSGAQAIISVGSYQASAAFIRDARQENFKGIIANLSFVGTDQLLALLLKTEKKTKLKLTSGLLNSQVVPSWTNTDLSIVREL